jgi:hypothetical protein
VGGGHERPPPDECGQFRHLLKPAESPLSIWRRPTT